MLNKLSTVKQEDDYTANIILKINLYSYILSGLPQYDKFSNWIKVYYIQNNINCDSNIYHRRIQQHYNSKCTTKCKMNQPRTIRIKRTKDSSKESKNTWDTLFLILILLFYIVFFIIFIIEVINYFRKNKNNFSELIKY